MRGAKLLAVIAAVVALLGGGFGVASAAEGGEVEAQATRVDACFNGACGSATYTVVNKRLIKPVKMSVKDNKCDAHPVYIQAGVWDVSNTVAPTWMKNKNYNRSGCKGGYASWNTYIQWPRDIKFVVFRVCVNDAGSDTCRTAS
ncbi:hypothetical protein SAMN05216188_12169 [Lentzea xinjiangensis]|uniref:Peptidase inhibitor family I36 n=1 Tax=Lentzea xinjiangensis TaxID=402600 RepID=A0A1H9UF36_9PSEU|nr:hypothetical protein [Lentzea xinjiangensis]SES07878.1 hypothetical protein SAMN05216188_12169 [Lentzea xinjiangensis]